jgi:hypothetical protein
VLTKPQRNEVFRAIEDAGLSPGDFVWEPGVDESWVRHRASGAYFVVGGGAGNYTSHYLAGDGPTENREGLSWYRLIEQVGFWLSAVRLDIETPDLWAQLQGEAGLLGAVFNGAENTPFTAAEQEEIAGQLRELKDYVSSTYSLSEGQTQLLEERLDSLAAAARRVGRKDWVLMAAGVMLGYVLTAALPPEAARDILGTLLTSVEHILGGGPLGLPAG